jgi:hypothetical protein
MQHNTTMCDINCLSWSCLILSIRGSFASQCVQMYSRQPEKKVAFRCLTAFCLRFFVFCFSLAHPWSLSLLWFVQFISPKSNFLTLYFTVVMVICESFGRVEDWCCHSQGKIQDGCLLHVLCSHCLYLRWYYHIHATWCLVSDSCWLLRRLPVSVKELLNSCTSQFSHLCPFPCDMFWLFLSCFLVFPTICL